MSFTSGDRFTVDLDADDQGHGPAPPVSFVKDVLERNTSAILPPSAPSLDNTAGFPAHRKRGQASAFKQRRLAKTHEGSAPATRNGLASHPTAAREALTLEQTERRRIDEENRQRLAAMSPDQIEHERQELFDSLDPDLIQRLLRRANIDDGSNEQDFDAFPPPDVDSAAEKANSKTESQDRKKVSFAAPESTFPSAPSKQDSTASMPSKQKPEPPQDVDIDPIPSIHFPKPPQPPSSALDPSSPDFLANLHQQYFPNLSYDPSSLSWMTPIDESKSSYNPSLQSFSPSSLRFSFHGTLISPTSARQIPVTEGLHHHGEAPEAAGYTVPELAILARSKVSAQRCMAYQTLGRILYRLGKGEFGREEGNMEVQGPEGLIVEKQDGAGGMTIHNASNSGNNSSGQGSAELARGLWEAIEEGRIIETLTEEVGKKNGHLSAKTYAEEALWNWRRGGGRRRKAV